MIRLVTLIVGIWNSARLNALLVLRSAADQGRANLNLLSRPESLFLSNLCPI
jgi:hypothetical protein